MRRGRLPRSPAGAPYLSPGTATLANDDLSLRLEPQRAGNSYETTQHALSLTYTDVSVQERMHVSEALRVMKSIGGAWPKEPQHKKMQPFFRSRWQTP